MTDPELERIAREGVHNASDDLETLVGLSGRVEIAGREFPAPCTGVLALLEQIASPFVAEGRPEVDQLDVFRALYVLSEREKVLMPILRAKRLESQLERLPEPKDAASMYVVMEQRRKLAEAQAGFDADALAFGTTLGRFDLTEAIRDIGAYLTLAGGFEMLPNPEDGAKKKPGGTPIC